ncbi:uncharacterized protein LOC129771963 isoform X3 [Toxorhynchites rutilus septentrionalis]|uniref:uncharacterized protein LOC129771963 isoform X3 n=1 Tax=Toxorhynchites rutilus septentrionalis TaxID=329112 RepID=UPI002478A720|nr:uncharacterized protein LOC129771963 isoform X3 [Toxorhynchites rutilus septentrionalis]
MVLPPHPEARRRAGPLPAESTPRAGRRLPMGKCVSKQPVSGLNELGSSPYLAICNEDDIIYINVGQSESKKASKKAAAGHETKGTAMSFGFKKHKIHQSSGGGKLPHTTIGGDDTGAQTGAFKKVTANASTITGGANANGNLLFGPGCLEKEKAAESDNATVISNPGVNGIFSDKNGNMDSTELIDDDTTKASGRSTPRLQPPKKDSHGGPYRNNRFGFRSNNVIRPASVGLQPKTLADCDKQHSSNNYNNNNNINATNNNNVYVTDKRRSKSAPSAASARTNHTSQLQAPSHHIQHGALHRPQPKYQSSANATKIAPSESSTNAANGAQQVVKRCDQAEQKNTSHNPLSSHPHQKVPNGGNAEEPRSQLSVNNAIGRQCVSSADPGQQHAAANLLTKVAPKAAAAIGPEASSSSVAKFTLHSSSLPKPQYPVPISLPSAPPRFAMDAKGAKQAVNISRKGTLQSQLYHRSQSAGRDVDDVDEDSNPDVDTSANIRMPRQRYRNLEMVMSGRHKFEVRDLETLTAEPIVQLPLPKLPSAFNSSGQHQQPIPLSGLVRSSELPRQLSDEIDINDNRYESEQQQPDEQIDRKDSVASSDVESFEEKLAMDNNSSEKSLKGAIIKDLAESHCSKTSSPGSSRASWCNAGESMAAKECSSLSLSSSDDSNVHNKANRRELLTEDVSTVTITIGNPSLLSSLSAAMPMDVSTNLDSVSEVQNSFIDDTLSNQTGTNQIFRTEETKFAEIAAAVGDAILLDDETSPTDSLVSSCTDSDDARKNRKKRPEDKQEMEKEKDIDEISPEFDELTSPVSPGTPTHASNSLSLSDGGKDFLIDDEIADQPALMFDEPTAHNDSMIDLSSINLHINEDTPTLRDSVSSIHRNRSASRSGAPMPKPRKIMSDVYDSPVSIRKNRSRLPRSESLDTLSPCDSIASDDFMLDFNSSMDSIDRPPRSNASGSASALLSMDELQLWSELENKGGQLMHEWSKLLRSHRSSNNNTSRESITPQLPARATRLLTRRLQNNATPINGGTLGSDSPRSMDSLPRRTALSAAYKTATLNQFNNNNTDSASTATNSAEDLTLLDKSLRNSMLHDVVHFKKQLVRLRRILQETDTLNPFENNNGQFFTTATTTTTNVTTGVATAPTESASAASVDIKQQENTLIKESGVVALALLEDQRQELADLRRQVVYLQGELTAKDRTIRQQQNLIEKYEIEREKLQAGLSLVSDGTAGGASGDKTIDTISTATQTERLRPMSFGGQEGLASRSEPASPSHAPVLRNGLRSPAIANNHSNHPHHIAKGNNSTTTPSSPSSSALINSSRTSLNLKPKTQISSVYAQLSSIKHSTHNSTAAGGSPNAALVAISQKRSSLGSHGNLSNNNPATNTSNTNSINTNTNGSPMKSVRTTHIGNVPIPSGKLNQKGINGPASPTSPAPANGIKLLKSSIRMSTNGGGNGATFPGKDLAVLPKPKISAIKPPSSFGCNTFPDPTPISHKSRSAPVTPLSERVPSPPPRTTVPDNVVTNMEAEGDSNNNQKSNRSNGAQVNDDDREQIAEAGKDDINNKINSLRLANGLTGYNDSNCKDSNLVI